jgi:hypothetical protein
MAVVLSTSGGVYHWNVKERTPVRKFPACSIDGILTTTLSPDGELTSKGADC